MRVKVTLEVLEDPLIIRLRSRYQLLLERSAFANVRVSWSLAKHISELDVCKTPFRFINLWNPLFKSSIRFEAYTTISIIDNIYYAVITFFGSSLFYMSICFLCAWEHYKFSQHCAR